MRYSGRLWKKGKPERQTVQGEIDTQDRCGVNLRGVALSLGSLDPGCKRS